MDHFYGWQADFEARWQPLTDKQFADYFKLWADKVGFVYPNTVAEHRQVAPTAAFVASPNPAGGPVTLTFGRQATTVSLSIYSVSGRLLERIYTGPAAAGQRVTWDGVGYGAGTYLAVLCTPQGVQSLKVVRKAS
jgi:hypothetical protein